MRKPKITIGKYGGNDLCSWAVFVDGRVVRDLTGLNRSQARYYRDLTKAADEERRREKS